MFFSPGMETFIKSNKDRYKAFIAFTVDYAPFYITAVDAGERVNGDILPYLRFRIYIS